mmetsp:Transcript_5368/g.13380  ORF Transcript_5368/g.13380 Transcript_5368/m.13380 type:complete len:249 (+) Transcript_5368:1514-2260(+)
MVERCRLGLLLPARPPPQGLGWRPLSRRQALDRNTESIPPLWGSLAPLRLRALPAGAPFRASEAFHQTRRLARQGLRAVVPLAGFALEEHTGPVRARTVERHETAAPSLATRRDRLPACRRGHAPALEGGLDVQPPPPRHCSIPDRAPRLELEGGVRVVRLHPRRHGCGDQCDDVANGWAQRHRCLELRDAPCLRGQEGRPRGPFCPPLAARVGALACGVHPLPLGGARWHKDRRERPHKRRLLAARA